MWWFFLSNQRKQIWFELIIDGEMAAVRKTNTLAVILIGSIKRATPLKTSASAKRGGERERQKKPEKVVPSRRLCVLVVTWIRRSNSGVQRYTDKMRWVTWRNDNNGNVVFCAPESTFTLQICPYVLRSRRHAKLLKITTWRRCSVKLLCNARCGHAEQT